MTIITKTEEDVQSDVSQEQDRHNDNITDKAAAESIVPKPNRVTNGSFKAGKLLLAKELKELISFKGLMETDGHRFQDSGRSAKCCCPFHPDRTPSFVIYDDDMHAKCYGCDWFGDIFAYEMKWNKVEFKEAWGRLLEFHYKYPRKGRKAKNGVKKSKVERVELTDKQKAERKRYSDRLANDSWIATQISQKRKGAGEKWRPETLQALGAEGSLGWTGDCLAFIYPTGIKYRKWPDKQFFWETEGISLWRDHLLPSAKHIYLTESETDAIALIDSDVEVIPGNAVIAVPSATSFLKEWAPRFSGKIVTLCFDNDDAGENGVKKIAPLLAPHVAELYTIDLKEAK